MGRMTACLVALWMITAHAADAQLGFGVFGGLNYTSVGDVNFGSVEAVFDSRSGYNFGVFVDLAAGPFAFRPGIGYVNTGSIFEGGLSDAVPDEVVNDLDDSFNLSYVFIPLDARFRFPLPFATPYLLAGPELRFLSSTGDADDSFKDNFRSFVVAGAIGAGVELALGSVELFPELRYGFDLSGIAPDEWEIEGVTFRADEELRSRAFVLRLGVGF